MNLREGLRYGIKNLLSRRLRSWLTVTGMVIGVVAIVVILAVSEGFNEDIRKQLEAFGADQMFVYPIADIGEAAGGFAIQQTSGKIFQEDVDDIEDIPGVHKVARVTYARASVGFKEKNISAMVFPSDKEIFEMYEDYIEVESGRIFKEGETQVAFFAADAATEYFGKDKVEAGSVVKINGRNYRVVGVQKRIGTSLSAQDDAAIYVPFDDKDDLFGDQFLEDEVGIVMIQIDEGFDANGIKDIIERKLAANHGVRMDELDFSVITAEQVSEIVDTVLAAVQIVLALITLIASFVGAIGIANTMFMNVLERIREIGILKSMGATKGDILLMFLIESAIMGIAGGVIGLGLGYLLLEVLVELFDVPVLITPWIVSFVFLFSVGTGLVAGFFPAKRAADMDPVEALGY
jgi:putative ABC transport system permease protein